MFERNLGSIWIAVLTGFNQPLGLAQGGGIDEHNDLLFLRWVEGAASHGADSIIT